MPACVTAQRPIQGFPGCLVRTWAWSGNDKKMPVLADANTSGCTRTGTVTITCGCRCARTSDHRTPRDGLGSYQRQAMGAKGGGDWQALR